ncbi:hypothetical protein [Nitratireductor soli]|uniref:hypothetical protein n=1 Tax=Nitratireductor soli TaxID=1670619 RepID=UPI0012F7987A|nr:hypothetical protein [Nitratireductor soli]
MIDHDSESSRHSGHRLSVAGIENATGQIDPAFRDTPQFMAESLSSQLGSTRRPPSKKGGRDSSVLFGTLC